jgi:hypothetical protein
MEAGALADVECEYALPPRQDPESADGAMSTVVFWGCMAILAAMGALLYLTLAGHIP